MQKNYDVMFYMSQAYHLLRTDQNLIRAVLLTMPHTRVSCEMNDGATLFLHC